VAEPTFEEEIKSMKKVIQWTLIGSLIAAPGIGNLLAQDEEEEGPGIAPVEIYICSYHDGKGPSDLATWTDKWNAWVDKQNVGSYSAWTMTPFYYSDDQDFDFIWLGVSPDGATLGRAQDAWLSSSGSLSAEFAEFATCPSHNNFASMNIKQPPDDGATSVVLSFSDCKIEEGKNWDDVGPALSAWSEYRTAHGSQAGMWVMWPALGLGDVDFNFKFVTSYRSYESLGMDYDQYGSEGYEKADELFTGVLDCDSARSYNAVQRRAGSGDDN
jgi:hypothetical protein